MKQVKIKDLENANARDSVHGGIMLDDGSVICGCCGGICPADERGETWELIEEYEDWVNLDCEILGDDFSE